MNWTVRYILVLLLLSVAGLILTSCNDDSLQKGNASRPGDVHQIQDSLDRILHTVFDNSEKLALEKAFVPFWNDSNFFYISNGLKFNYNGLKKSEEEYFYLLRQQKFNFSYQKFDVIDQDNAIASLAGRLVAIQKDGITQTSNIAETVVFKKVNGTWTIVSGHESYSPVNEAH